MPLVSIIVPVYNTAPYLCQCLDSLLAQTLRDIEVICVNDGSSDDSPYILDEYAKRDARIHVIHQANRGLSGARNAGIKQASAKYIGFVDSDDWIAPQTYEAALEKLLQDNELDVVCWGVAEGTGYGDSWQLKKEQHPVTSRKLKKEGKIILSQEIREHTLVFAGNKLYKAGILQKHEVIFTEKQRYEDTAFWLKYSAWARTGFYMTNLFYYYQVARPGSIMTEKRKTPVDSNFLPIFEDIYDYYRQFGLLKKNRVLLSEILARMIQHGLDYSSDTEAFLDAARIFVARYPDMPDSKAQTFCYLKEKKAFIRFYPLSPLEKMFSVMNVGNKKVFRILGMEFAIERSSFKRKK